MAGFDELVHDEIVLALPARPGAADLARLVAVDLCGRLGFTAEEVEDLTVALDELCHQLLGDAGRGGVLDLRFRPLANGVEVVGRVDDDGTSSAVGAGAARSRVDEFERVAADGVLLVRLQKSGREADPERLLLGVGVGKKVSEPS